MTYRLPSLFLAVGYAFFALGINATGPASQPIAGARNSALTTQEPALSFDRFVIDNDFPGAYQVEVADINGDSKPDIIVVGGATCAWYENPTWKKRIITGPDKTPGIISSATADLDGDGKAEVAIAYDFEMNEPNRGELLLAVQGKTSEEWTTKRIGHFGSIHRVRWGDYNNNGRLDLIVASIFGETAKPPTYDQAPAKLVALRARHAATGAPADWTWDVVPLVERPVIHAIEFIPRRLQPGPGYRNVSSILTADSLGVAQVGFNVPNDSAAKPELGVQNLFPGAAGTAPDRGCSEIHIGRLAPPTSSSPSPMIDQKAFYATIEPWHGNQVVVWTSVLEGRGFGQGGITVRFERTVIDNTLDAGHALWVADVNRDGTDEIFAGYRGGDHRVSMYQYDGKAWNRTVIDRDIAAQDLRGGDLDGDGTPDIVATGGATHNVVWYRPRMK